MLFRSPFKDDTIPLAQKPAAFVKWATSYYTAVPDDSPATVTAAALSSRQPHGVPTAEKMSQRDAERIIEPGVVFRSGAMLATDPEIHRRTTRRAFFDAEETFPEVAAVALWCDSSMWTALLNARFLGKRQVWGNAREPCRWLKSRLLIIWYAATAN